MQARATSRSVSLKDAVVATRVGVHKLSRRSRWERQLPLKRAEKEVAIVTQIQQPCVAYTYIGVKEPTATLVYVLGFARGFVLL